MLIGLVVGLVLVAVPLYLWRRPEPLPPPDSTGIATDGVASADTVVPYLPLADAGAAASVQLSAFTTIRCSDPGPGTTSPERCDHITYFEDALSRAIRDNAVCAPSTKTGASLSFVLELDFRKKAFKLYRGKSSSLPEKDTQELFNCVKRGLPTPEWGSIPHQHVRYVVNVTAAYPPSETF